MKKLFYLFLLLPFSLMVSCSDDKDFSPVDMTITLSGVTQANDNFYTVSGDDVTIENLTVKAIDNKNTILQNVIFYFNGIPLVGNPVNPFRGTFSTEGIPAGTYSIDVTGNLLQEDASIKIFAVSYNITIVDDEENLPAGVPDFGSYSQTVRISEGK